MLLKEIIKKINQLIPDNIALKNDKVGYIGPNPENIRINKINIVMDIFPNKEKKNKFKDNKTSISGKNINEKFDKTELTICHHPPLFSPENPTYVIHSNWDIIKGGANDALAETLGISTLEIFDKSTGIGRIGSYSKTFIDFKINLLKKLNLDSINIVNPLDDNEKLGKIAIVSGYGLSNSDYIKLAKKNKVDAFLSGDLTQKGAILAKNLNLCIIDINHHKSEIPGLIKLSELISTIGISCSVDIQETPWITYKI